MPRRWWPVIREAMPAFDPQTTPTRAMGAVAECFRTQPEVLRSNHPHVSFAARGPRAPEIVADHSLEHGLDDESPLGRLYDLQASVLLLGVGHDRNTSLHLSEIRAFGEDVRRIKTGAPVQIDGRRQWIEFVEPDLDDSVLPRIGDAFADATGLVRSGNVGAGRALLMPQPALVDFGVQWFLANHEEKS